MSEFPKEAGSRSSYLRSILLRLLAYLSIMIDNPNSCPGHNPARICSFLRVASTAASKMQLEDRLQCSRPNFCCSHGPLKQNLLDLPLLSANLINVVLGLLLDIDTLALQTHLPAPARRSSLWMWMEGRGAHASKRQALLRAALHCCGGDSYDVWPLGHQLSTPSAGTAARNVSSRCFCLVVADILAPTRQIDSYQKSQYADSIIRC